MALSSAQASSPEAPEIKATITVTSGDIPDGHDKQQDEHDEDHLSQTAFCQPVCATNNLSGSDKSMHAQFTMHLNFTGPSSKESSTTRPHQDTSPADTVNPRLGGVSPSWVYPSRKTRVKSSPRPRGTTRLRQGQEPRNAAGRPTTSSPSGKLLHPQLMSACRPTVTR